MRRVLGTGADHFRSGSGHQAGEPLFGESADAAAPAFSARVAPAPLSHRHGRTGARFWAVRLDVESGLAARPIRHRQGHQGTLTENPSRTRPRGLGHRSCRQDAGLPTGEPRRCRSFRGEPLLLPQAQPGLAFERVVQWYNLKGPFQTATYWRWARKAGSGTGAPPLPAPRHDGRVRRARHAR